MKSGVKRFYKIFIKERRFKKEFKKQFRLLVTITLGFTIAFTWRQTIFDVSQAFVQRMIEIQDSALSSVVTSLFITIVSILAIYLTSHYIKDNTY